MSADIWLEDAEGNQLAHSDDPDLAVRDLIPMRAPSEVSATTFNLTYNLSPMLWAAGMPPWSDFIGMRAGDAGLMWEAVVEELVAAPATYKTLNPTNGWGTYEGAVEVLTALAQACAAHPDARIGGWL